MFEVVIVEAVRTAIGKIGGALSNIECDKLAAVPIKECLDRTKLDPELVDEVIIGQAKMTADASNVARVAALRAGIPVKVPAFSIMRQCGSGLDAVNIAAIHIMCGLSQVVIAGGVESMSTAPYYLRKARYGYGAGNGVLLDPNTESQPGSQPEDIYGRIETMSITAETLASKYKISRYDQDFFAHRSQEKALRAIENGYFTKQIVGVPVTEKNSKKLFNIDEHPRKVTLEKLSELKSITSENGTVTAGNSTGRNDGASALLLMSSKKAQELKLEPLVRFITHAVTGVHPAIMGIGPVTAIQKALGNVDLTMQDIDLIELNEAFAAQCLACVVELGLQNSSEIINVNGGAIALGHPLGATGSIIATKLIHDMVRLNVRYGMASLCVAGGQGIATIFNNFHKT